MTNKRTLWGGTLLIAAVLAVPAAYRGSEPGTGNWPMWGGTPEGEFGKRGLIEELAV